MQVAHFLEADAQPWAARFADILFSPCWSQQQCAWQLLDWDEKRLHFFGEMRNVEDGSIAAYTETLGMNVDLVKRKSAPYPDWALARIRAMGEAHAQLPRPPLAGAVIGIRRKG